MSCFPALLQSPCKAKLRPATWLSCTNKLHSHSEKWRMNESPQTALQFVIESINYLNDTEQPTEYILNKVDTEQLCVQVFVFTPMGWLDVVEIKLQPTQEEDVTLATVYSFSTGVLPAWVPFGFVIDSLCCFLPFLDGKANQNHIGMIREAIPTQITQLDTSEDDVLLPRKKKST